MFMKFTDGISSLICPKYINHHLRKTLFEIDYLYFWLSVYFYVKIREIRCDKIPFVFENKISE